MLKDIFSAIGVGLSVLVLFILISVKELNEFYTQTLLETLENTSASVITEEEIIFPYDADALNSLNEECFSIAYIDVAGPQELRFENKGIANLLCALSYSSYMNTGED